MNRQADLVRATIRRSPRAWAAACGIQLRPYQAHIARAVKQAVLHKRGLTFVIILPRQSGKNELQAHIFAWLMFRFAQAGGKIVSVSPTFKPQTQLSMERVRRSLDACVGTRRRWKASKGYLYEYGKVQLQFFSGERRANVLGATADLLLSVDEAQSISPAKFDKDFDPMTASTNATRLFWGTAWTSNSLLERERRRALHDQETDGIQRLFSYNADDVCAILPDYRNYMARVLSQCGRNHPLVRSQFYCETIDSQVGMFNPGRLALIAPDLTALQDDDSPASESGRTVAFLIDVAGVDETRIDPLHTEDLGLSNPGRDATALSVVEVDLGSLGELGHPTYHVVRRFSWVGENHLAIFGKIKALAENWNPRHFVIDATGVGEGLWSLLERAFPDRVEPVKFTQQEKSEMGWRFLAIIEAGRFRDHAHTDEVHLQYTHCIYEILPGPGKTLRWGVPEGARGPDGGLIHDDFVMADALMTRLDLLKWSIRFHTFIIPGRDPLLDMDHNY